MLEARASALRPLDPNADDWSLRHVLETEIAVLRSDIGVTDAQLAGVVVSVVRDYLGERVDEVPGVRLNDSETVAWIHTQRQVRDWLDSVTQEDE